MEILYKKKVDINEGLKSATVSKSAMVFFKDVFFAIPYSQSNMFGGEAKFNGKEIFKKALQLLEEDKTAELYDYLMESIPEEQTYYVNMLDVLTIKIGWWAFGGMYFRRNGEKGMRKTANIQPKSFRIKLKEFYSL